MKKYLFLLSLLCILYLPLKATYVMYPYSGYVLDKNTHAPVANHPVTIAIDSVNAGFSWSYTTYTDAQGRFVDTIWVNANLIPCYFHLYTIDVSNQTIDSLYYFSYPQPLIQKTFYINTLCLADFYTSQGANPTEIEFIDASEGNIYNYYWDFGDGTSSTLQNPVHQYTYAGDYQVKLDIHAYNHISNSYCQKTITKTIQVGQPERYALGGQVFASQFPYDEGFACLYQMHHNNYIIAVDSFLFNQYGYYHFTDVPEGEYMVKIYTENYSFKGMKYAPTYYGNVAYWEAGNAILLNSDKYNNDIQLIQYPSVQIGPGSIQANIQGACLPCLQNKQLLLLDANRNIVDWALSDNNGNVHFNNIAFGHYIVKAEVTGYYSSEQHFDITPSNPNAQGCINIVPGTTAIPTSEEIVNNAIIQSVYPNPTSSFVIIETNLKENANLEILNSMGQKVYFSNMSNLEKTKKIDISTFSSGLYYLKLTTANKSEVQKILVQ